MAYNPLSCGACDWSSISYEGVPWEYSWTVPFDMFVRQLSESNAGGNSLGTTIFNPGNEPDFMTPFLYNYFPGKQWKSVLRAKGVVDEYYSSGRSGLPGNDDAGALSSWLVWTMMGLYPVVTQPVYLLLSPWFDDMKMNIGNGTLRVTADRQGGRGIYVQSVKVNGVVWDQNWVSHDDLVANGGGTIEFILGEEQKSWDTGNVPPSPGHI